MEKVPLYVPGLLTVELPTVRVPPTETWVRPGGATDDVKGETGLEAPNRNVMLPPLLPVSGASAPFCSVTITPAGASTSNRAGNTAPPRLRAITVPVTERKPVGDTVTVPPPSPADIDPNCRFCTTYTEILAGSLGKLSVGICANAAYDPQLNKKASSHRMFLRFRMLRTYFNSYKIIIGSLQ